MIEWVCFIVLDIGLEVTDSLPGGTRAVAGLFQSFAVRASGFPIVSLSALAPSFQYVSVHEHNSKCAYHSSHQVPLHHHDVHRCLPSTSHEPACSVCYLLNSRKVALSIRSTNV